MTWSVPLKFPAGSPATPDTAGWRPVTGSATLVPPPESDVPESVQLGPGTAEVEYHIPLEPGRKYRLSARIKAESGAEEVRLGVRNHGKPEKVATTSWADYRLTEVFFNSGEIADTGTLFLLHPAGPGRAWIHSVQLDNLGPTESTRYLGVTNSLCQPPARVPIEEMGVRQLPNTRIREMLDMRFGLFIHWGVYAGPGRGEWLRYAERIPQDRYERLALPDSGDEYFSADRFQPEEWAQLARDTGMKFMCLTARHHDGFNLFPSPHPNAWHSGATHGRDFVGEYVSACRAAGLGVGIYFSPLNWRYPGVFDVRGTSCKPNNLGFTTSPANRENARIFKEENYANLGHLLTQYGELDYLFWDGGWLGHSGSDADAAFFHEPGKFLDPSNHWPIDPRWQHADPQTGKPLGIMGMVRHYQPKAITNSRYGWIGDIASEEQGPPPTGPIRHTVVYDKCITMGSSWGYSHDLISKNALYSADLLIEHVVNSACRNMVFQLNVGPDRRGAIHPLVQARLREVGKFLGHASPAIHKVFSGPWDPEDHEFGYTYRDNVLYVHLLKLHTGSTFRIPPVGPLEVRRAWHLLDGRPVAFEQRPDRTIHLSNIDRSLCPVDTIVAVEFDRPIASAMTASAPS